MGLSTLSGEYTKLNPELRRTKEEMLKFLESDLGKEIGWRKPEIEEIHGLGVDLLGVKNQEDNWDVWKLPIFAGLIAKQLQRGKLNSKTDCVIDGGGVSISYCLNNLAETISATKEEVICVMSRFYPREILAKLTGERVDVILAPKNEELSLEGEFSAYVSKYGLQLSREGKKVNFLSHVKFSTEIAHMYAEKISKEHNDYLSELDYLILSVGSGGTLSVASKLKELYPNIKIIIAEPEEATLIADNQGIDVKRLDSTSSGTEQFTDYHESPHRRVTHGVPGPHFEKTNPFIEPKVLDSIDGVFAYSRDDWRTVSTQMRKNNQGVGHTTAAGIAIGQKLKKDNPDAKVLTVVYEPLRDYALKD